MSLEKVKKFFREAGLESRVLTFEISSATVPLAAKAVGCEEKQIAKTMAFLVGGFPLLVVCAGNTRIDNRKFKARFSEKAKMIPGNDLQELVGHALGGVCPFCVNEGVKVCLDRSLEQCGYVYPAAGSENSAVRLSLAELRACVGDYFEADVCKIV